MQSTALLALLPCLLLASSIPAQRIRLRDVSKQAGLDHSFGPRNTYGGPSVADLDDDGYPDLLLTHHDSHFIEIYFNQRNGTFWKVPIEKFRYWFDTHALNAFRYGPRTEGIYFAVSRGGAFGRNPAHNVVFRVARDRKITQVSGPSGLRAHAGRGRTTLYLPLRDRASARNDLLSMNGGALNPNLEHHVGFRNTAAAPRFSRRGVLGFSHNTNWYGTYCDYDNDGVVDVASFETLRFHRVLGGFKMRDVTADVLPDGVRPVAVVSVAELDFDGDGLWDLYVATTTTGDLKWRAGAPRRDYLFRNVGGRYVDATDGAGIPQDGLTRGVVAADMDNDGRIDLVLSKYWGRSVVLRNMGGGKFRALKRVVPSRIRGNAPADGVTAVDYDADGRVDLVLSEGDAVKTALAGFTRVFRNESPRAGRHFLLVRVGNAPSGNATPLHAVVRVRVGKMNMARRVGPPGVSVSVSVLETLHFGLGAAARADAVTVTWLDGTRRRLTGVAGDRVLTVGRVAATG